MPARSSQAAETISATILLEWRSDLARQEVRPQPETLTERRNAEILTADVPVLSRECAMREITAQGTHGKLAA
jgi:hypothetical protein